MIWENRSTRICGDLYISDVSIVLVRDIPGSSFEAFTVYHYYLIPVFKVQLFTYNIMRGSINLSKPATSSPRYNANPSCALSRFRLAGGNLYLSFLVRHSTCRVPLQSESDLIWTGCGIL